MAFFELDDVFTYQDANDIKKLWASDTVPADPGTGEVWLDTSATPNQLKRYNGSSWDNIGELTAGDLLNLIKTVDGSGSGLDADILDGQEGSYYRNASNLNAGTVPQARLSASDLLTLIKTVDGSGSGLDADKLDNQEGSYYRNASNLNAGTVSRARLGALWCYNNTDETEYPYIQTGSQGIYSPVAGANTFSNAFTSSVIVVATAKDNGEFCSVISVTTTGFTIRHPDDTGFAYWIATGKKT